MARLLTALALLLTASLGLAADPSTDDLRKKPITTAPGELGDLLRKWWKEGTAAGNAGDWYDNRDGGHSDLDTSPWPQLQRFTYTAEDIKLRRHWAAAHTTRKDVTFGNSSTSAPPEAGGSNVRLYYTNPTGLPFLYTQYLHNNLYIYPEHRDHDPGHNGRGDGYGDLYPTNTPYLITSQGSSGSDQPFMRALPTTLAAFRPEVKKKLVQTGLLMPTVQMILRSTNTHLADPGEYLTGKAHPSVFEGSGVDPLKMAKVAHGIELETIPPMVQLKVVEEDRPRPGRDFFEPDGSEDLARTPDNTAAAVLARVWRGAAGQRRLVVSAAASYDVNKRPLKFRWVVLRGDAGRIRIRPRNAEGSEVELIVPYHPRRPIAPGSAMESNRVDVGVFVHNGAYHSAPGFVTFYSLDSEARTYAEGRVLEIGYGMGETTLGVSDWDGLFAALQTDGPAGKLPRFSAKERSALAAAAPEYRKLHASEKAARERRQAAEAERQKEAAALKSAEERKTAAEKKHAAEPTEETKKATLETAEEVARRRKSLQQAEAASQVAQKPADEAAKAVISFLDAKLKDCDAGPRGLVDRALAELVSDAEFANRNADALAGLLAKADGGRKAAVEAARKQLVGLGVASGMKGNVLELRPLRPGSWTVYEKAQLERYHCTILANLLYPGLVSASFRVNFVDQRLTTPKAWRDVYRHDAGGRVLGWTRHDGDRATEFNADGCVVLEADTRGRCVKARTVRYEQAPAGRFGPNTNPLRQVAGDEVLTYAYDNDEDLKGKVVKRERVETDK